MFKVIIIIIYKINKWCSHILKWKTLYDPIIFNYFLVYLENYFRKIHFWILVVGHRSHLCNNQDLKSSILREVSARSQCPKAFLFRLVKFLSETLVTPDKGSTSLLLSSNPNRHEKVFLSMSQDIQVITRFAGQATTVAISLDL
jgi:hypothetical protein